MFLPIGVDNPLERPPYANWALIAVNVAVFLIGLSSRDTHEKMIVAGGVWGGKPQDITVGELLDMPELDGIEAFQERIPQNKTRLHQLVTHAFLHVDFWHLLGNMIFLFVFGNNINDALGHVRFLLVYLGIVVAGGICHVVQYSGESPAVVAIGASGAISGIVGMYLILFPRNDVRVLYFLFLVPRTFVISSVWIIALWIGLDTLFAVTGAGGGIAYWIHVVGYAAGIGFAVVALKARWIDVWGWDIFSWLKEGTRKRARIIGRTTPIPSPAGASPSTPSLGYAGEPAPSLGSVVSLDDLSRSIANQIAQNQTLAAMRLYDELTAAYPDAVLPERTQVAIAVLLARAKERDKAIAALFACLNAYPNGQLCD